MLATAVFPKPNVEDMIPKHALLRKFQYKQETLANEVEEAIVWARAENAGRWQVAFGVPFSNIAYGEPRESP